MMKKRQLNKTSVKLTHKFIPQHTTSKKLLNIGRVYNKIIYSILYTLFTIKKVYIHVSIEKYFLNYLMPRYK